MELPSSENGGTAGLWKEGVQAWISVLLFEVFVRHTSGCVPGQFD